MSQFFNFMYTWKQSHSPKIFRNASSSSARKKFAVLLILKKGKKLFYRYRDQTKRFVIINTVQTKAINQTNNGKI